MNRDDEFNLLMDVVIIDNGIPNKTAKLSTLNKSILTLLQSLIEEELISRRTVNNGHN